MRRRKQIGIATRRFGTLRLFPFSFIEHDFTALVGSTAITALAIFLLLPAPHYIYFR